MKSLRVLPLALVIAACSSVNVPLSPYRIDVQQGNALEQESVEKLKPGLTRSQVRFLLGTPLLVDPFRNNRWDYVFNFRKAGKLTEERRLVLYFDGDVLSRIEAEGFAPMGEIPSANVEPLARQPEKQIDNPREKAAVPGKPVPVAPVAASEAAVSQEMAKPAAVADAPKQAPVAVNEAPKPAPVAEPQPVVAAKEAGPVVANAAQPKPVSSAQRSLDETSIVAPLHSDESRQAAPTSKPVQVADRPSEAVALQAESNVAAVKPEVVPEFPSQQAMAMPSTPEEQVMAALNSWAKAWQGRDEEAYLAAYAASFRPEGGISRAEWEKRRRLLLGLSRNIEVKIDGPAFEAVGEDRAQVSFRQFYRSDTYQDAVIKLLKFVRVDNLWLIEEEKVLAPIKVRK